MYQPCCCICLLQAADVIESNPSNYPSRVLSSDTHLPLSRQNYNALCSAIHLNVINTFINTIGRLLNRTGFTENTHFSSFSAKQPYIKACVNKSNAFFSIKYVLCYIYPYVCHLETRVLLLLTYINTENPELNAECGWSLIKQCFL